MIENPLTSHGKYQTLKCRKFSENKESCVINRFVRTYNNYERQRKLCSAKNKNRSLQESSKNINLS